MDKIEKSIRNLGYDLGCALGNSTDKEDRQHSIRVTMPELRQRIDSGYTQPLDALSDEELYALTQFRIFDDALYETFSADVKFVKPR